MSTTDNGDRAQAEQRGEPTPERIAPAPTGGLRALEDRDPWLHRSDNMRCRTCMFFARKGSNLGRCRRHAPTMSGYPVVYPMDWCGDHKLDEGGA